MKLVSIQLEHRLLLRSIVLAEARETNEETPVHLAFGVMAMLPVAFALSLTPALRSAQPADDADFAALQADAKKSFKEVVTPFVDYLLHALSRAGSTEGRNQLRPGAQKSRRNCLQQTVEAGACHREIPRHAAR